MRTKEFGLLGTTHEQLLYTLLQEQRKTNEILSQLYAKKEEKHIMEEADEPKQSKRRVKG